MAAAIAGRGTTTGTSVLMAAAIGGFTIVHAIADAARGQQTLTERRVTLAGAAPNREVRPNGGLRSWSAIRITNANGASLPNPTKMLPTSPRRRGGAPFESGSMPL
ncbi:MAG TPA: hypothetical protein VKC66_37125 [Xanthobacteraceae bacterium]|nr:hypothetical protein [Xanthobacteraceae bacterium]